jgi:hypothetical protein
LIPAQRPPAPAPMIVNLVMVGSDIFLLLLVFGVGIERSVSRSKSGDSTGGYALPG